MIDEYIQNGGEAKGGIKAEFYNDCKLIPDPSKLNQADKNDCLLEKQNKTQSYYTRGRHSNCDCFYISQNYFKLDRQTVRENSNFIILFPQCDKNLDHIHRDHCTHISNQEFKAFCHYVWRKKYNFVTIDLTRSFNNGKYRENLDRFMDPKMVTEDEAKEYEETIRKIRQRNEDERTTSIRRNVELEKEYKPIIKATTEQTRVLKEGLKNYEKLTPGMDALDFYLNQYSGTLDQYFGIRKDGQLYFLGDKEVRVQDNNIYIDGHKFTGTTGLWALLMENTPVTYTTGDLENYAEIIHLTNAFNVGMQHDNAKYTDKGRVLLPQLLLKKEEGSGIFLPSDINSLRERLKVLLAEFNVGNQVTRNEIVAIVDNLVERKKLKKEEAQEINNYLQNVNY